MSDEKEVSEEEAREEAKAPVVKGRKRFEIGGKERRLEIRGEEKYEMEGSGLGELNESMIGKVDGSDIRQAW